VSNSSNPPPVDSILDVIGHTPLVRLQKVAGDQGMPVYGKCEFLNPGGSVKDRIGLAMIEAAEAAGDLKPGGTVVEGTGGNTGVALAMVAAIKGYRAIFTMPDKMSSEKVRLLKALGADVVITPTAVTPDSPEHYVNAAKRIAEETPGGFLANQFYNRVNTDCHYETTAAEIWEQTGGKVKAIVCGAGTGGTISGIGRFMREKDESIKMVLADPVGSVYKQFLEAGSVGTGGPYLVEGIGGDKIPTTMDFEFIDEVRQVTDRESFAMARRMAREEGMLVGGSSGTLVHVAVQVAREIDDADGCVVAFLCDSGERYLSKLHSDEWMRENRLLDADPLSLRLLVESKPGGLPPLISIARDATVREALELMREHGVTQLPITEDGGSVGTAYENKLMGRVLEESSVMDQQVGANMEAPLPVASLRDSFDTLRGLLSRRHEAVLIRDAGVLVGILTRSDLLELMG
jgi:cystathionine beta-synthase